MRKVKRVFYFVISFVIAYYVYNISVIFYKLGMEDISKNIIFIALGIFLIVPIYRGIKVKLNLSSDSESIYLIDKAFSKIKDDDITKLQGITLKKDNDKAYVDALVVSNKGIFNIVFCTYSGKITITKDGRWKRYYRGKKSDVESPFKKVLKNKKILLEEFTESQIKDIVVLLNDRVDIKYNGDKDLPIIRHYELANYIENYNESEMFDEVELYDKLYPLIYKEKNINNERLSYERFLDIKWSLRSRILVIASAYTLYICNVILK